MPEIILTYQYRIKDANNALRKNLFRLSGYVNFIWNYCNNTQKEAVKRQRKWLSGFDLNYLTAGTNKAFKYPIPAQTVQSVCEEWARKRNQFKKPFLNNRTNRKNRHLPWIPFKKSDLKYDNKDSFTFNKLKIKTWFSRDFLELQHKIENLNKRYGNDLHISAESHIKTGSVVCNSEGKWFINVTVKTSFKTQKDYDNFILLNTSKGQNITALDPGLNPMLTESIEDPEGHVSYRTHEPQRFYKKIQERLAKAQRAKKKKQIKKIHTKARNQRKDYHNKLALGLIRNNHTIVGTTIDYSTMKKSNLKGHAKAWSDVGLGYLTNTLKTKALMHNVKYVEVSERLLVSTQTCSHCFALTGPRGRKGLSVSAWHCVKCGKRHNRNENSADNHRLAYKEACLIKEKGSTSRQRLSYLSHSKQVDICPEKELKSKARLTLQDVEGSFEESLSL